MTDEIQPLEPGEHVDLDDGTKVKRYEHRDDLFEISNFAGDSFVLSTDDIETVAALAGLDVENTF